MQNESHSMSARYRRSMDWMNDEDWYSYDEKKKRFFLTDKAPEKAKQSFELYKQANWKIYGLKFNGHSGR